MADLRIVDAPEIPTENITGEEKLPTGGSGNYSISLDSLADYTKTKKDLVDTVTVDGKVNGVRQELDAHIEDLLNPHQVTKGQIGLGNVDNTADSDKPVSNSTQSAIISAVAPKADKTYVDNQLILKANKADVYTKSETYTKQESNDLVNSSISTALTPVNISLDLVKRGVANRYDSSLTYNLGERVVITSGDIVKSTIDDNVNDPNMSLTGWLNVGNTGEVDSIADLLAIPNPKNGSRVYVKSYIFGLDKGGKDYVYQSSKSSVNDGGRCINGWVAQKETLDIFDFGATKYTGTDWTGADYNLSPDAYYVSSNTYNNYKNYCDSVKQKGYFPNGDYVIQDGSYKLPKCGLRGDDKEGTRIFTALIQAGKIFEYNTLGVYSSGFANFIENLTIYTHRANKSCFVMTVNTPTRGAKGDSVNIYSSGEIINYYDVWYLKWENCGFYGYFRGTTISNSDPLSAVAFVNKNNSETNNTYYDKCSVLDVKHVFLGRKAGFTSSGVGLLFANCSFERIGECAFDLMYTNTTFLTCHFEQLGLHNGFKTPANDFDRTILIYAGENTVNLVGNGNIWLGGSTPNNASYSIFNAEGRALIELGSYRVTRNNRPLISTVGTYATGRYCSLRGGVVVNSEYSNTNPIDLHFSNVGQSYRQKSNQSQHLISDIEKASTTYQSVAHHPLITGAVSNRSVCVVSVRVYETPILVRISGRVIRVGNTNKKCAQYLDIDASFLIEPLTPTNPQVINFNVVQKGVDNTGLPIAAGKSLFGVVDETALKALFTFKRLTAENTDSVSPFDVTYALVMSTAWIQVVADVGGVWQINDVKTEVTFAQEASKDLPHLSYIHNHNNNYV